MSTDRAAAEPGCTASGLSSALATVATGTAGWLASHPEAHALCRPSRSPDTTDQDQSPRLSITRLALEDSTARPARMATTPSG